MGAVVRTPAGGAGVWLVHERERGDRRCTKWKSSWRSSSRWWSLAALADRIRIAYPIILIIGGMVLGVAPFIPLLTLDPDLVSARPCWRHRCSRRPSRSTGARHRSRGRPILELAIRLVLTTTVGVAVVAMLVIGGMEWGPAFVLGAIVSPPDAVATIAVVGRLKLPKNLITILEGESLMNDATALVLYRVAVAAVVTGSFSLVDAVGQFFLVAALGILIGLALGWLVYWFLSYVVRNPEISVAVSLLTPVAAYLIAEEAGFSGVLAVVAAGLVTAQKTLPAAPSQTRVQLLGVWQLVRFLTEGFAFVLIGLQLPFVLDGIEDQSIFQLVWYAVAIIATTVLIRVVWVFWEIGGHLIPPTGDAPLWGSTSLGDRWSQHPGWFPAAHWSPPSRPARPAADLPRRDGYRLVGTARAGDSGDGVGAAVHHR